MSMAFSSATRCRCIVAMREGPSFFQGLLLTALLPCWSTEHGPEL